MIVLEGADSSGKSTLSKLLAEMTGWPLYMSDGRVKSQDDLDERTRRYDMQGSRAIYDRHAFISGRIYHSVFGDQPFRFPLLGSNYIRKNLIIYCRSPHGQLLEQNGVHDTPEHVAKLNRGHHLIVAAYERHFAQYPPDCTYTWDHALPQPFKRLAEYVRRIDHR